MQRDIPEGIKREVRKRSGFGCVLCGLPIYDYEHIEEFAVVQEHDPENIVLLCPNHHRDKISGRIGKNVVRAGARNPFNRKGAMTRAYSLLMEGTAALFKIGSARYSFDFSNVNDHFTAIRLHGLEMVGMTSDDGGLLLDLSFVDYFGQTIFAVRRGEMSVSTGVWDYRMEGPTIRIFSALRKTNLEMTIMSNGVHVHRGLLHNGPYVAVIEPEHLTIQPGNFRVSGLHIQNCRVGVDFG